MLVLHSFPSTHIYRYSICHQDSLYSNSRVVPPSYSLAVSLIRALVLFAGASAYLSNSFPGLHDGTKTNACHSQGSRCLKAHSHLTGRDVSMASPVALLPSLAGDHTVCSPNWNNLCSMAFSHLVCLWMLALPAPPTHVFSCFCLLRILCSKFLLKYYLLHETFISPPRGYLSLLGPPIMWFICYIM